MIPAAGRTRCIVIVAVVSLFVFVAGCATTVRTSEASWDGRSTFEEDAKPRPLEVTTLGGPTQNTAIHRVLYDMAARADQSKAAGRPLLWADCGIASLYANDTSLARRMLDKAVLVMTTVGIRGRDDAAAKSIFAGEERKLFKGEPHERAVLLLYRGLLYMAQGDIDNAQACFRFGAIQDAIAASESARCDWLSHDVLLLHCKYATASSDTAEFRAFIAGQYGSDTTPGYGVRLERPVYVVVAVGGPPVKVTSEVKGPRLVYTETPTRAARVSVRLEGRFVVASKPSDNCCVQAVTRGRRHMDRVLQGKADAKIGLQAAGAVLEVAATVADALVGGDLASTLLRAGRDAALGAADNVNTSADVRQMAMVPHSIYVVPVDSPAGADRVIVQVKDASGKVLAEGQAALPSDGDSGRPAVVLARFPY